MSAVTTMTYPVFGLASLPEPVFFPSHTGPEVPVPSKNRLYI